MEKGRRMESGALIVSDAETVRERMKKHLDSREICTVDCIPHIFVFTGFSTVSGPGSLVNNAKNADHPISLLNCVLKYSTSLM